MEEFVRKLEPEQREKLKRLLGGRGKKEKDHSFTEFLTTFNVDDDIPSEINARINTSEEMRQTLFDALLAEKGVETAEKFHKLHLALTVSKRGEGRRESVQSVRKVPGDMKARREEIEHQGE